MRFKKLYTIFRWNFEIICHILFLGVLNNLTRDTEGKNDKKSSPKGNLKILFLEVIFVPIFFIISVRVWTRLNYIFFPIFRAAHVIDVVEF